jgi:ribosome maturation factor RimP
MQSSELEKLVNEALKDLGFDDCYLIETRINLNKVEIFLDSDLGIDFSKCQKVSRWLEAIFDEKKYFGEVYVLEVSSAGVGSPLKFLRQYSKNIGRNIDIRYNTDRRSKGKLLKVEGDKVFVEYEITEKEGKKNKKVLKTDEIKFEDIVEAKIKISFN